MTPDIRPGTNIAVKVPPHEHADTVRFLEQRVGLPVVERTESSVAFAFGSLRLWIDHVPTASHSEVWLELQCSDLDVAVAHLVGGGAVLCDAIEPLGELRAHWLADPAGSVWLLSETTTDAPATAGMERT
jgi:hypothetical protein